MAACRWSSVATLALDEGSRTSAALAQILLRERFGLRPRLLPLPLDTAPADCPADAVVVIGDRGMSPPSEDPAFTWDLGQEWACWTGLPFVFALWAARPHAEAERIDRALAAARDEGVTCLAEIARQAAPEVGLPEAACLSYLRDNLQFHLGPRQRAGWSGSSSWPGGMGWGSQRHSNSDLFFGNVKDRLPRALCVKPLVNCNPDVFQRLFASLPLRVAAWQSGTAHGEPFFAFN